MSIKDAQRARLVRRSERKLSERSAVLYARSIERWNSRTPLPR